MLETRVCSAVHTAARESAAGCSAWGALRPQDGQAWRTPALQLVLLQLVLLQPYPLRSVAIRACTCDGPLTGIQLAGSQRVQGSTVLVHGHSRVAIAILRKAAQAVSCLDG